MDVETYSPAPEVVTHVLLGLVADEPYELDRHRLTQLLKGYDQINGSTQYAVARRWERVAVSNLVLAMLDSKLLLQVGGYQRLVLSRAGFSVLAMLDLEDVRKMVTSEVSDG